MASFFEVVIFFVTIIFKLNTICLFFSTFFFILTWTLLISLSTYISPLNSCWSIHSCPNCTYYSNWDPSTPGILAQTDFGLSIDTLYTPEPKLDSPHGVSLCSATVIPKSIQFWGPSKVYPLLNPDERGVMLP